MIEDACGENITIKEDLAPNGHLNGHKRCGFLVCY